MSLREHIQAIYEEHNKLTPDLVLDAARHPDHPLHSRFEWDDTVAGEKYRKIQAQELIVVARVRYRDGKGKLQDVRAFHAMSSPDGGFEYQPAEEIASNEILTAILLRDMERDWKALKGRWSHFKEFVTMIRQDLGEEAG